MAREGWGKTAGGTAGAAIGTTFGGPVGGFIGELAGSTLGDLFQRFANRNKNNQPMQMQQGQPGSNVPGKLNSFAFGTPSGFEQVSPYTQQQQGLYGQTADLGFSQLQNPYAGFEPIRERALADYNNRFVPQQFEQFNMAGGNSKSTSPIFEAHRAIGQSDLQQALAAMQAQYGLQSRQQGLQMLGLGLQPQYQNHWVEGQPGAVEGFSKNALPQLSMAALQGLSGYYANKPGTSEGWKNFLENFSNSINGQKGEA